MFTVENRIRINRTPEDLYSFLLDFENLDIWGEGIRRSMRIVRGKSPGLDTYEIIPEILFTEFKFKYQVLECKENYYIHAKLEAEYFSIEDYYELQEQKDASVILVMKSEIDLRGFHVFDFFAEPFLFQGINRFIYKLKRVMESGRRY